jgi:hypothetical protein
MGRRPRGGAEHRATARGAPGGGGGGCGARLGKPGIADRLLGANPRVRQIPHGVVEPQIATGWNAHKNRSAERRGDTGVADQLLGGNTRAFVGGV